METRIAGDVPPHYAEFYLAPLRDDGLRAADWVRRGGESLGKPTHFEARDGKY
jgi:hypothetical protein